MSLRYPPDEILQKIAFCLRFAKECLHPVQVDKCHVQLNGKIKKFCQVLVYSDDSTMFWLFKSADGADLPGIRLLRFRLSWALT